MAQTAKRFVDVSDVMVPLESPAKRPRTEVGLSSEKHNAVAMIPRTSDLQAPIMLLSGHGGEIFTAKFHPDGSAIASGGFDRQIYLWNVYGECENYAILPAHKGAVMDLHFSPDGSKIYTASTDKTIGVFDFVSGTRLRRLKAHKLFVNSCCPVRKGPEMLCSGSDDGSIKIWDLRSRAPVRSFEAKFPIMACVFNDSGDILVSGGIDNNLQVWDIKMDRIQYSLVGHTDSITGLSLDPTGSFVLSNSMDNTARIWDIRPYAPLQRCTRVFIGHQHNFEKNLLRCSWSPSGNHVSCGSGDRFVYIWETNSRKILYKLPGHSGSVNEVCFHPKEPIILSASSDKQIYLGEVEL